MILIVGAACLATLCGIVWVISDWRDSPDVEFYTFVFFASCLLLAALLGIMAINTADNRAMIQGYHAAVRTLEQARKYEQVPTGVYGVQIFPLETAAIQQQVLTWNTRIAETQYWANSPWFNWFYDPSIRTLQPIR